MHVYPFKILDSNYIHYSKDDKRHCEKVFADNCEKDITKAAWNERAIGDEKL